MSALPSKLRNSCFFVLESIIEFLFNHQLLCPVLMFTLLSTVSKHPANRGSLPVRICISSNTCSLSFYCRVLSSLTADGQHLKRCAFCFFTLGSSFLQCLCCCSSQTHQPFRLHPHQPAEPYLPGAQQRGPHPLHPQRLHPAHELLFPSGLQSPRACPPEPVPGSFTPDLALPGRAAPQLSGPRLVWLVIGALFDGLPSQ